MPDTLKIPTVSNTLSTTDPDTVMWKNSNQRFALHLAASFFLLLCFAALLSSCSSLITNSALPDEAGWAVMPFSNSTSSAFASRTAGALVESHLRARGVSRLVDYSNSENFVNASTGAAGADENTALSLAKKKAREAGYRYGVTGSVEKWRDTGVIGRAHHVGVSMKVIDLATDDVLWRDSDTKRGSTAHSVAAVTSKTVEKLVGKIALQKRLARLPPTTDHGADSEPLVLAAAKADIELAQAFPDGKLDGRSVAFYYGVKPPVKILSQFDRVVVEPDNISATQLRKLTARGAAAFAYVSVFEVGPYREFATDVDPSWILGENKIWNSKVMDLSNPGWLNFLLKRVDDLMAAGYEGLFLDTMDSYHLYATSALARERQEAAAVEFLRQATLRHPSIRMISNRGFDILENGAQYLEGLAAESLYASWDNLRQEYVKVNAQDREWLLGKLNEARQRHSLDIISIEYLPPAQRIEAKKVARKIAEHGFIPWVANPELDSVGVGLMEVIPRKVMMLYDSRIHGDLPYASIHTFVATPLEYLGLVPDYLDLATEPLPQQELKGTIAGIVSWSDQNYENPQIAEWFRKQMESSVPVVFLGVPGFPMNPDIARFMGIQVNTAVDVDSLTVTHRDEFIGFDRDITPRPEYVGLNARSISEANTVHLSYKDRNNVSLDLVVTADWGGYVMDPAVFYADGGEVPYWVVDPFSFLAKALSLGDTPMPDVTTENGRRLWLAHIDGDALPSWAEMPGRKLGAEVIKERVLDKYQLPHTISIVEGEMTGLPQYAERRPRMIKVAKSIFAMPNVEIASHTYSHPYRWQEVARYPGSGKFNLPIEGYQYDARREVLGSAKYIDEQLAPPGKKTEVFLWSGNALPSEDVLAAVDEAGLVNLNGGSTTITKANNSHALIGAMARPVGDYVQVYAPILNENVYTNDWLGPFDGFRRVIETLELTEHPRRIKPINIYYHFYAGTKIATVRSLDEIYTWSVAQDITPVYASEYSVKVPDYREAGVAQYVDGSWKLSGLGNVRSVRILGSQEWPQLAQSKHVVGARALHDGLYIHTDGSDSVTLALGKSPMRQNHIVSSNGRIESWNVLGSGTSFRIKAHVPVEIELGGESAHCGIVSNGRIIQGKRTGQNTTLFKFPTTDTGNAILNCQA